MEDQVFVVGFDALPVALKSIAAGEMSATIRQDPARMGRTGVELAVGIVNGEDVQALIPIDGLVITADNVGEYYTE